MNSIIKILLSILFVQFLVLLYIKLIYEKTSPTKQTPTLTIPHIKFSSEQERVRLEALVNASIEEIIKKAKTLPQSTQYTVWDKETVAHIGQRVLKKSIQEDHNNSLVEKKTIKKVADVTDKKQLTQKVVKKNTKKISTTKKVEKFAKAKLGKKYVWGATGPNKFDCSGFTKEVFRCTAGINIPRVSREQAKIGKYIKYKNLKRGDMVFFDTEKKFTGKVNHVGIYLSNGNFIHASSAKKKVIITNFNKKPFYKRRFLWGRRIIN